MNTICAALMLGADGRAHAYRLARLTSSAAFVVDEAVSTDLSSAVPGTISPRSVPQI